MAEVKMPKMGDGMEEGMITSWLKKEGDRVQEGDAIAEVETDKANVEIPAEESGVLSKILVQAGTTVSVGATIAHIGEAGSIKAGNGAHAAAPMTEEPKTPVHNEVPIAGAQVEPETVGPDSERIKASPLARKMAAELGIDLARLRGTGPSGRIVERDIKQYQSQPNAATNAPAAVVSAPAVRKTAAPASVSPSLPTDIKPSKMREAIARRTQQSTQNAPHFYVTMLIEMDRAMGVLKELNTDTPDSKITVNDLIIKACSNSLLKVPEVNSSWTSENTIRRYSEINIGVAVGIEEGLIIPVIKNCESKSLRQISADAKALITRARAYQLQPSDYSGGTFSISNLGMMGVDEFTGIINPPESAILAIGGISRDPVVEANTDNIVIRSRMKVTLSSDHRVLDGVTSARFLQEVKKSLEAPFTLLN